MIQRTRSTIARSTIAIGAIALMLGGGLVATAQAESMDAKTVDTKTFMKTVNANADVDKTISMEELDTYAKKRFAEIENDKDKTLDQKELKGRLSEAGMTEADTDKDKTVDEKEFVDYADKLFKEANVKTKPGNDHPSLSEDELKTPAGEKLMTMLR